MADNGSAPVIEDDEEVVTPGYIPPAEKSLQEIQNSDADDPSLVKYKQTLLGEVPAGSDDGDPRNVIVQKMIICPTDRDEIEINLTGDIDKLKDNPIIIKEGCEYRTKIVFKVKKEIVSGLRLHVVTSRKGVRVAKESMMVGSYGPKVEEQIFMSKPDEAPKGMIARGHYTIKSKFIDDDKVSHLQWEWSMDIKKDWE